MQGLIHTGHMTHTLVMQYNFCIQHATFGHSVTSLGRSITVRAQVLAATHEKRDKI